MSENRIYGGDIFGGGPAVLSTVFVDSCIAQENIKNVSSSARTESNGVNSWDQVNAQVDTIRFDLKVGPNYAKSSLVLKCGVYTVSGGGGSGTADYLIDVTYIHPGVGLVNGVDQNLSHQISNPIEGYQEFEITLDESLAEAGGYVHFEFTRDGVTDVFSGNIKAYAFTLTSE